MTTFETTGVKSVHIKECWPYEYVKPVRKVSWRKKAASVKTPKGQKLLKLPVYEMSKDFCESLNYAPESKSCFKVR